MNPFLKFYPGDGFCLLAANVLVQIAVVVALAGTVAMIFARHRAAARHAIWLSTLSCVLLSPAAAWLAAKSDWPLISLRLLPEASASDVEGMPGNTPSRNETTPRQVANNESRISEYASIASQESNVTWRPQKTASLRGAAKQRHDIDLPPFSVPGVMRVLVR